MQRKEAPKAPKGLMSSPRSGEVAPKALEGLTGFDHDIRRWRRRG